MLTEVMKHYGLASDLHAAGYYETDHHRQLCREVHAAILGGRLVAIAGMVGCGKTALPQHLQADLYQRPGPMTHFILRRHDRFLPAGMRARTGPPEPRAFAFIGGFPLRHSQPALARRSAFRPGCRVVVHPTE
ncbi:MAG: hypothetical protein JOZ17_08395 [Acetobacteraceae bacterium]|nr:hypothetical protein [Acetobacteraceae bacterium]